MDAADTPQPARRLRLLVLGAVVAVAAAVYLTGTYRYLSAGYAWDWVRGHLDDLKERVAEDLPLAAMLFFAAYVAVTALSLPAAAVLSLAAGALFGRWLGTGVVLLGATAGATLAFLSSRYLLRDFVRQRFGPRLAVLDDGVRREGAYYLLTLRLVPVFPFFLINLGMGLTPIRAATFAWVSLLGMLPGTFLYVNAGTELAGLDSPRDALSAPVLGSLALLGVLPLLLKKTQPYWRRLRARTMALGVLALLLAAAAALSVRTWLRYTAAPQMAIAVREYTNAEYPEDPADRSIRHGGYNGRTLRLIQRGDTVFDFVLEPTDARTATIAFKNIDVGLMTPSLPPWTKADAGLTRIALTDRQWNRQQVRFDRGSPHLEISGGDGFEATNLFTAELAKNCLNAGLWEVLLFDREDGKKALYYQNWFTFPLGHYKTVFERNTGLRYRDHWYYLEHWFNPAGTPVKLDGLRRVASERAVPATFDRSESILTFGEQARKRRTVMADNLLSWGDFYDGRKVRFATFLPPGRYSVNHPWKNEYWRMDRFDKALLRDVVSPPTDRPLQELELVFSSSKAPGVCRFVVSGFELNALPRLPVSEYAKGLYMPMGIGTPPFFQGYDELEKRPPQESPFFCVQLDGDDKWINHHDLAIDGPVLHRDDKDERLLHVYLLSYERHSLIGHWVVTTQ